MARLKTKNSKKNTVKAEVVEDSEEHKNAAKAEVVETLETHPTQKKKNEVFSNAEVVGLRKEKTQH